MRVAEGTSNKDQYRYRVTTRKFNFMCHKAASSHGLAGLLVRGPRTESVCIPDFLVHKLKLCSLRGSQEIECTLFLHINVLKAMSRVPWCNS